MASQQEKRNPYILGITGTIGSGKSTVGKILQSLSIPVIDTDHIVHDLLDKDSAVIATIRDRFGESVLKNNETGSLVVDRKALGQIVFDDPRAKKDLEEIVHPATILACRKQIAEKKGAPVVAVLVPLLFEAKLESEYDEIWTIYAKEEILVSRLAKRDSMTLEEIQKRLQAQMPQEEKNRRAEHVIDNSGTRAETEKQIKTLVSKITSGDRFK